METEKFDHSLTGWPLNDKHALFKCHVCHPEDSYLLHKIECIDCHRDVHQGQLGTKCNDCHNEKKFKVIKYKHKESDKSPKGKHIDLQCIDCHIIEYKDYYSDENMLIKFIGTDFFCSKCHDDVHDGEYGTDCLRCHNQISFK